MNKTVKKILITLTVVIVGCVNDESKKTETLVVQTAIQSPDFDVDTAYYFVEKQVSFGPRVPNSSSHRQCADFLINTLKNYADTVIVQNFEIRAYNGANLRSKNIIASFKPNMQKRILLAAHWDSRPYADHDPDPTNSRKPIDGANDGASGVGILLEIARQLSINEPVVGVDIILFDAEDYGAPEEERRASDENTWCLGAQFWATHPHTPNYRAKYGILLDMVGAKNATFTKEGASMHFAPDIVGNVWAKAQALGFGNYFQNQETSALIDDHIPINTHRNIPTIDIIDRRTTTVSGFYEHWHTLQDNMETIDKQTLSAVGKVVLYMVKNEN
ncbi:MAG: M28 family peptidase [Bacteroidales bacterium]|jgi:hypothetical protein|nr:M28 family peptidase [Bacteroidales bacterium]